MADANLPEDTTIVTRDFRKPWERQLQNKEGMGFFREVGFFVDSVESSVGRRTVVHEFPGTDHVEVEDLGRASRRFVFDAYVVGPEYMAWRDELREAFEKPGSGPLVHPYWGKVTAVIDQIVRIRETPSEGGMCRFTIAVVMVSEQLTKIAYPFTEDEVDEAADDVNEAIEEDFEDDFSVADAVGAVASAAQTLVNGVNSITSTLNKANGYVKAAMNIVDEVSDSIDAISDAVATLVAAPAALAAAVKGAVNSIASSVSSVTSVWDDYFTDDETASGTAGSPLTAALGGTPASGDERSKVMMKAFRQFSEYGDDFTDVNETTDQRAIEAKNQAAMIIMMRAFGISETCRSIAKIPFSSYNQAISVRDELSDELDALAEDANDRTYNALVSLRAAIVRHLTNAAADIPRVITHTPAKPLPALVIAHQLYADASRDVDIIDRNNTRNPCIVPGGEELEVLSDE